MRSFWSDPYLWVHLAGLAVVPILLDFCLLGLAVGESTLPPLAELGLVATVGVIPVLWMQWRSPFYIFSLLAIALRPTRLTDDQRRILRQFKTPLVKILTTLVAGILVVLLWQLYQLVPVAAVNSPWNADNRWIGLAVAAIAFLGANLFAQVPASVAAVLMTGKRAFASVKPYPTEAIFKDFTVLGIPVRQVLPLPERPVPMAQSAAPTSPEPITPAPLKPKASSQSESETLADVVILQATEVIEVSAEAETQETLDDLIESELSGLSDTLADALGDAITEPTDATPETSHVEPSDVSPRRQPPSYEDPEATLD